MFIIMCERSGNSIFGYARAPMKSEGKVLRFETREQATVVANCTAAKMRSANVSYSVEEERT